jgi:hypothetical protein
VTFNLAWGIILEFVFSDGALRFYTVTAAIPDGVVINVFILIFAVNG